MNTRLMNGAARLFFCAVLGLAFSACSSSNSQGKSCTTGEEKCACFSNKTCLDGLTCLSDMCVAANGVGGNTSVSSSTDTSVGGSTNASVGGDTSNPTTTAGGTSAATGGASSEVGGTSAATGGASAEVGGTSAATGGASAATGGDNSQVGGTSAATGGTTAAATTDATGGTTAAATTDATGGSTAATGGTSAATGGSTGVAGPNLIEDPEFANVDGYWSPTINAGDSGHYSVSGGQCCLYNDSSIEWASFNLGYPRSTNDSFTLEANSTYTFSFRASGFNVNSLEAKVGGVVDPYAAAFSKLISVTSSLKEYSYQFTTTDAVTTMGVVFTPELDVYGEACFGLVSLTKN